jgi:hypothetical protein
MAYWRRGALCQSLKRPLGERVKVILLAACSIDLSMSEPEQWADNRPAGNAVTDGARFLQIPDWAAVDDPISEAGSSLREFIVLCSSRCAETIPFSA